LPRLKKALLWVLLVVLGAIISIYVDKWWPLIFKPEPLPVKIDFNDVDGCSQGKLVEIAKRQMGDPTLSNGADSLIICDNEPLKAVRTELPRELANRIPGCLEWRGWGIGGLVLVRRSPAICALPGGKQFVCDGPNARHALGGNAVGDSTGHIVPCPDDVLERFGFTSLSAKD